MIVLPSGFFDDLCPRPPRQRQLRPKPQPQDGHLSVNEVAAITGLSTSTVIRRFSEMRGVINHGKPREFKRRKKDGTREREQYRVLRIPKPVLQRYLAEHAA